MQVSHSRVETFVKCPYQFKLKYHDGLETFPDDAYNNALYAGTGFHECLQVGIEEGIKKFYNFFPIATDAIIGEAYKLELLAKKSKQLVPEGGIAEVELNTDNFKGFIDWLVPIEDGVFDLYDFKYCSKNSALKYPDSNQLHLYKYFFEKTGKGKIRNMYYLICHKTGIRQKNGEELYQYQQRIGAEVEKIEPYLMPIEYDPKKVIEFLISAVDTVGATEFPKKESNLCHWCEFESYCKNGDKLMLLPSNERVAVNKVVSRKLWIYGAPFTGKTYFANAFPDPLMLNTDGNVKFVDAPRILIKDEVKVEGRITTRKFAWEVFKEVIAELEKKQNSFKTIVVDLLEDTYEQCRVAMYDKLGITHESDDSFRAWDKIRQEWLGTMKRLMTLDYENIILISHEDTSRDLTKKTGDKISAIKPNLNDKMANKIAGMVDVVARVICEDNDRMLTFKTSEVMFGGGRLTVKVKQLPLDFESFCSIYPNVETVEEPKVEQPVEQPKVEEAPWEAEEEKPEMMGTEEQPKVRTRKRRVAEA